MPSTECKSIPPNQAGINFEIAEISATSALRTTISTSMLKVKCVSWNMHRNYCGCSCCCCFASNYFEYLITVDSRYLSSHILHHWPGDSKAILKNVVAIYRYQNSAHCEHWTKEGHHVLCLDCRINTTEYYKSELEVLYSSLRFVCPTTLRNLALIGP